MEIEKFGAYRKLRHSYDALIGQLFYATNSHDSIKIEASYSSYELDWPLAFKQCIYFDRIVLKRSEDMFRMCSRICGFSICNFHNSALSLTNLVNLWLDELFAPSCGITSNDMIDFCEGDAP